MKSCVNLHVFAFSNLTFTKKLLLSNQGCAAYYSHRYTSGLQTDESKDWTQSCQTLEMDAIYEPGEEGTLLHILRTFLIF